MTKNLVGDEPFAVILGDDVIDANPPALKQMINVYERVQGPVLAVERVPQEDVSSYGVVALDQSQSLGHGVYRVTDLVEKPRREEAPSNLAIVGRYILSPRIFHFLENTRPGAGREIQLTDGIGRLLREESVYAYEFQGQRYDCGSKLGYLQATVNLALKHPELADDFRGFLTGMFGSSSGKRS